MNRPKVGPLNGYRRRMLEAEQRYDEVRNILMQASRFSLELVSDLTTINIAQARVTNISIDLTHKKPLTEMKIVAERRY